MNEKINNYIAKLWIKSTELVPKAKKFQKARFCVISAESYKPKKTIHCESQSILGEYCL